MLVLGAILAVDRILRVRELLVVMAATGAAVEAGGIRTLITARPAVAAAEVRP